MGIRVGMSEGEAEGNSVGGRDGAADGRERHTRVAPVPEATKPLLHMQVVEADALFEFTGHWVQRCAPVRLYDEAPQTSHSASRSGRTK